MSIHYEGSGVRLFHGDCLDVLRAMPDASVDSVVTDPPYGLEFMGKDWDSPWKAGEGVGEHNAGFSAGAPAVPGVRGEIKALPSYTGSTNPTCRNCGGTRNGNDRVGRRACRCERPEFPNTTLPRMVAFQQWCELWAVECLRVLKPGGHLLAFGGTRTWHRLTCAVEDAGFEIRDSIAWLYGSGFPKSLDVSKAIDKAAGATREVVGVRPGGLRPGHQNGSGGNFANNGGGGLPAITDTAPATDAARQWEGWGTALKPAFEPVVVARKPLTGTVASNVQAWGTGALNIDASRIGTPGGFGGGAKGSSGFVAGYAADGFVESGKGRWPANVVLDEDMANVLDEQSGTLTSGANPIRRGADGDRTAYGDFSGQADANPQRGVDSGGASRFFYVAKAPKRERPVVDGTAHPTVKPLTLMRWLVRLVTPPGGTVLEPFAGSGTTVEACILEGFRCVAIEKGDEYLPLIVERIARQGRARIEAEVAREPDAARAIAEQVAGQLDIFGEATA